MINLSRRRFLTAAGTALAVAPLARLTSLDFGALATTPAPAITAESLREAMAAMRAAYIPGPFTLVINRNMADHLRAMNMLPAHYVVSDPFLAVTIDEEDLG